MESGRCSALSMIDLYFEYMQEPIEWQGLWATTRRKERRRVKGTVPKAAWQARTDVEGNVPLR